jgi:methyltransferase (TIGR00027 family)
VRDSASTTASLIAVSRGLARLLPDEARLVVDPYGERFTTPALPCLVRNADRFPAVLQNLLLTVQVRTRLIDDAVTAFAEGGGAQVLLLGAGYDCRAHRFPALRFFEVDHPATQEQKRAVLAADVPANATYVAWDFERDVALLPAELARAGHDKTRMTLTVWEGVTMYLSAAAVDATVRAVAALSAPGSPFVFTYMDRAHMTQPGLLARIVRRWVAGQGEPLVFGWDPPALAGWLAERGLDLEDDVTFAEGAHRLLPSHLAARLAQGTTHHLASSRIRIS